MLIDLPTYQFIAEDDQANCLFSESNWSQNEPQPPRRQNTFIIGKRILRRQKVIAVLFLYN